MLRTTLKWIIILLLVGDIIPTYTMFIWKRIPVVNEMVKIMNRTKTLPGEFPIYGKYYTELRDDVNVGVWMPAFIHTRENSWTSNAIRVTVEIVVGRSFALKLFSPETTTEKIITLIVGAAVVCLAASVINTWTITRGEVQVQTEKLRFKNEKEQARRARAISTPSGGGAVVVEQAKGLINEFTTPGGLFSN